MPLSLSCRVVRSAPPNLRSSLSNASAISRMRVDLVRQCIKVIFPLHRFVRLRGRKRGYPGPTRFGGSNGDALFPCVSCSLRETASATVEMGRRQCRLAGSGFPAGFALTGIERDHSSPRCAAAFLITETQFCREHKTYACELFADGDDRALPQEAIAILLTSPPRTFTRAALSSGRSSRCLHHQPSGSGSASSIAGSQYWLAIRVAPVSSTAKSRKSLASCDRPHRARHLRMRVILR